MTGMTDHRQLVARYGSPLYVYRLDRIHAALADLRASLPQPSMLCYSLKANPHPDVVAALLGSGCHAEISSVGELATAVAAAGADRCLYTGPGKTEHEMIAALRAGVGLFSVESASELRRLGAAAAACGVEVDCLVRVNVDQPVAAAGLVMAGGAAQFGADLSGVLADPQSWQGTRQARVVGLHFFAGSNIEDPKGLLATFELNLAAAARLKAECGIPLQQVDIGGGFAAPYARPGHRPRYDIADQLECLLDQYLPGWRDGRPRIAFESGRYLVAEAGSLICSIVDVKQSGGRTFVVLDSGIHHLGGLSGLRRLLPLAARLATPDAADRPTALVDVVGPLCTPADVFARDLAMPEPVPGDLVEIPNVGAYGLTASLIAFLGRTAAAEVVIDEHGSSTATRLVLGRQAINHPAKNHTVTEAVEGAPS